MGGLLLVWFGSPGRTEATGRGVMCVLEEALKDAGKSLPGITVALVIANLKPTESGEAAFSAI